MKDPLVQHHHKCGSDLVESWLLAMHVWVSDFEKEAPKEALMIVSDPRQVNDKELLNIHYV